MSKLAIAGTKSGPGMLAKREAMTPGPSLVPADGIENLALPRDNWPSASACEVPFMTIMKKVQPL
jgi:hypothetical protein